MSEILLIRHPETDLAGTFCGHSDPPVNATGWGQIAALLVALKSEALEAVYTSDLQRAQTLGSAIAENHQVPCITRPALREICFGDWEALRWAEIEQRSPERAAAWLAAFPHEPAPNGECFAEFEARVLAEFDGILEASRGRIALVTHGGVIRTILNQRCEVDKQTAFEVTKGYCSVYRHVLSVVPQ